MKIDNCVSWQTITTNNQMEKQQLINIHWQNVPHSDTFFFFFLKFFAHSAHARLENGMNKIQKLEIL